ncbi:hypothetical protein [Vibrio metschnikovii]|uniref:hypothetical protein n=1 Tax=Vibrio metschnikovii TaxID=28172 RepID=UPI002FC9F1A0
MGSFGVEQGSPISNDLVVTENDEELFEKIRDDLEQVFAIENIENVACVASPLGGRYVLQG